MKTAREKDDILVDRRELIKSATVMAGAAMTSMLMPSMGQAAVDFMPHGRHMQFKGTFSGRILSSHDGGMTWQVAADFGPDCPVLSLRTRPSGLQAVIGHKGYSFTLRSRDGLHWYA